MLLQRAAELLRQGYYCDHCLGRALAGQLLSGLSNEERGRFIRYCLALSLDAGEVEGVHPSNFLGFKFRHAKLEPEKPGECEICQNLFDKLEKVAKRIVRSLRGIEFETFLIGSVLKEEWVKAEERVWEVVGIQSCESMKSELNRELGKVVARLTGKRHEQFKPDVTIVVDFKRKLVLKCVRSLFVYGEYKKLVRGIPQCKWVCSSCGGKGCAHCEWKGKLYPISVQELIERPLLKLSQAKKSHFSGMGREDVDVRCLAWRPFVIELVGPLRRRINLKLAQRAINQSKRIKVRKLKLVDRSEVKRIKSARVDKSYVAVVEWEGKLGKDKLKELKKLRGIMIAQRTPLRVLHRRADKLRRRMLKELSFRQVGKRKLLLRIKAQSGLYVKEFITGDEGRTRPSVAEVLQNKPLKLVLDVVKIHHG